MFDMRPLPEWSQYESPNKKLYLCGAGTHPGGGVTGAPGYNAAHAILRSG
jgi:phytoene dehydrogenase-like protein